MNAPAWKFPDPNNTMPDEDWLNPEEEKMLAEIKAEEARQKAEKLRNENEKMVINKNIFDDMEGEEPLLEFNIHEDNDFIPYKPCSPPPSYYEENVKLSAPNFNEEEEITNSIEAIKMKSASLNLDENKENSDQNLDVSNISKKSRRGRPMKINK